MRFRQFFLVILMAVCLLPAQSDIENDTGIVPKTDIKTLVEELSISSESNLTMTIKDLTPVVSGQQGVADFKISQTQKYLILQNPELKFFKTEIYDRRGHLISDFFSQRGFFPQVKIPVDIFTGKVLFINIKDNNFKVIKTFKVLSEPAYTSKD